MHGIYFDSELSGSELMLLHDAEPIHRMHLRALLTEVFKSLYSLNPGFMKQYFERKCLSIELREQISSSSSSYDQVWHSILPV